MENPNADVDQRGEPLQGTLTFLTDRKSEDVGEADGESSRCGLSHQSHLVHKLTRFPKGHNHRPMIILPDFATQTN